MLGKVGKAREGAKGASHFKDLVDYISREADGFGREVAKGEIGFLNMPGLKDIHDLTPAIDLMDAVAEQARRKGKFRGDPTYHLILSWQEGEQPTPRQADNWHCGRRSRSELVVDWWREKGMGARPSARSL